MDVFSKARLARDETHLHDFPQPWAPDGGRRLTKLMRARPFYTGNRSSLGLAGKPYRGLKSDQRSACMKILPLAEAKAKLSQLVAEVSQTDEEISITRNGRAAAVLVSHEEFESWKETAAVLCDPTFRDEIR